MAILLTVLKFNTPSGADDMLELLKAMQARNLIEVQDAVVVTKDEDQQVQVRQPLGANQGKGVALGAATGALVGLVGGPVGAAIGLISGALVGGVAAARREPGDQEADLESLATYGLQPGESGLLVYCDEMWSAQIEQLAREINDKGDSQIVAIHSRATPEPAAGMSKEKIEAAYQSWQASLDKQRADLAALRVRTGTAVQSDRDAAQQQMDKAKAELNQLYQNVLDTLHSWQQQIETQIHQLEAQAKSVGAKAKADTERRLADARAAAQAARTRVKETLSMRLDDLKSDLESLRAKAAQAPDQAKEKLNQQVTKLQADWEAEQKRLDQLDKADDADWEQLTKSIGETVSAYDAALRTVEVQYEVFVFS